jgi:hypothetical protein
VHKPGTAEQFDRGGICWQDFGLQDGRRLEVADQPEGRGCKAFVLMRRPDRD